MSISKLVSEANEWLKPIFPMDLTEQFAIPASVSIAYCLRINKINGENTSNMHFTIVYAVKGYVAALISFKHLLLLLWATEQHPLY